MTPPFIAEEKMNFFSSDVSLVPFRITGNLATRKYLTLFYYHDLIECSRLLQRFETFGSTQTVAMEADSEYNLFSGPKTLQETLRDEYVEVQPQSNWAAWRSALQFSDFHYDVHRLRVLSGHDASDRG